jgi:dihydrolipoamide dehydrogenase
MEYDVIVLGGGPGGYPAAIKAAQLGKKVALVEAKEVGGTCLNRGCIPTKTLIAHAEALEFVKEAKRFGISSENIRFDYSVMAKKKDSIVESLRHSVEKLLESYGIALIRGFGKFTSPYEIKVLGDNPQILRAKKIIIATGSEPRSIAALPCDGKLVHDSTTLLEIASLPKSLVIIGGGVIGCEFAAMFHNLGVSVTIVEMMPRLLPMECETVSDALAKAFEKRGIKLFLGTSVEKLTKEKSSVSLQIQGSILQADMALVAVGRALNTDAIGLEKTGVAVNGQGIIAVNERMETTVSGLYAVGDIASRYWLAHVATHQGLVAAENACGGKAAMHYHAIPSVTFSSPEVATVGLSLAAAQDKKIDALRTPYPFSALGKAQATLQTEGFAQIVVDKKTKQILGAQVVGENASILIAEMGLAVANEFTLEALIETIHAHPTMAEAWLEAAMVANGAPLHYAAKKLKAKG